jgi:succinyl-CoA synthetase beta subunit
MFETLLGGLFGGLLRLAPEVFKLFDKKNERAHELRMVQAEMEFAKIRGEIAMRQTEAVMTMAEMDTMAQAFKEQSETAKNAGWFVSAISALVRPTVTYAFLALFVAVKVAAYLIAIEQGGNWKEVLLTMWGTDDLAVFNMILSFWFVGRVYERTRN